VKSAMFTTQLTVLSLSLSLLFSYTSAEVLNVPDDYGSIQAAIEASGNRDTILVQPGIYAGDIDFLRKNITVGSLYLTTGDAGYRDETIIDAGNDGRPVTCRSGEGNRSVLAGFTLRNGQVVDGGGVYCRGSSPTLDNLAVIGNRASGKGGGIFCDDYASPVITNSVISSNDANEQGGGIYCNEHSSPRLTHVEVISNSGSTGGGIYCNNSSRAVLTDVTVSGNRADVMGGGIHCARDSDVHMLRVAVVDNYAESMRAGGIYIGISDVRMENVTIARNRTDGDGGGIHFMGTCHPVLKNAVLWGNSPNQVYQQGSPDPAASIEISYSDIEAGRNGVVITGNARLEWGNGNIDTNPLFSDEENGDYNLTENSPCIDTGDPESDPDPDGTRADMGAFYFDQLDVPKSEDVISEEFRLFPAFPNPFNSTTTITYALPALSPVSLKLYDLSGREVRTLVEGNQRSGIHHVVLNASNMPSGLYFVRLEAKDCVFAKRIMLIR